MSIQIKPELEEIIRSEVLRGHYKSAEEFVEQAVIQLHEQEEWLSKHREEVASAIEAGWTAAERGELTGDVQVEENMRARKEEWFARLRTA